MYCNQCGKEVSEGQKFCSSCGAEIAALKEEEKPSQAVVAPGSQTTQPGQANQKPKQKNTGCLVIILVIVILVVIVYLKDSIFPSKQSSSSTTTSHYEGLDVGEEGVLEPTGAKVNLAITQKDHDELLKAARAGDQYGYNQLFLQGRIFLVEKNTRVLVIDRDLFLRKVRILEGPEEGKAGWVAYEFVKKPL